MTVDETVRVVQLTYPQIYLACHTRHQRKRSTEHRLSARDSSILAHLDEAQPMAPAQLSRHLNVGRSTVSEALKRLVGLGFIARAGGTPSVVLTAKGSQAVRATSVLEPARLEAVVASLSDSDRDLVCRGLQRLANACRNVNQKES
jgi:DNA-binding MarR family transcriptional regulator